MTSAAVERVEWSRERLRRAMQPPAAPARGAGPLASVRRRLHGWPLAAELIDGLVDWWSHHPLRALAVFAADASNAVARPLAQRHPLLLVLIGGLAGAGLARSHPWRRLFGPALLAGLLPQLAARIVSRLPLDTWLSASASGSSPSPSPALEARAAPA